jgi:6-phosphogluconolactonase (cycloisomerase 2 family)
MSGLDKYLFEEGDVLPAENVDSIDPDNLVPQTPARLDGGTDVGLDAMQALYSFAEIDSLEHDTIYGTNNSLIKIDDTHFILAYRGTNDDGFIKTFSIDGSYNITEIDSLEHDTDTATNNSLIKIDDTHFILAYRGTDNDGFIKTFSIDANADNITEIDSLEHDTSNSTDNSLVLIDSTHFALAYTGPDYDGYIKTFSIDGSYNITEIDSLEHDTDNGRYNSLVLIDSTHLALAYAGPDYDGYIKTFSIDANADNITEIDSLEHDTSNGAYNSLIKINDTHFALAYAGNGNDGYIKTFSIDANADNITEIDSLEHDTSNGTYNSLIKIDNTHFALAYVGTGSDGFITNFSIDNDYAITKLNTLEHDTDTATSNSLIKIDDSHLMLAYAGTGPDGFIKTFVNGSPGAFKATFEGVEYDNITPYIIDTADEDDVATALQSAIRTATSSTETVAWDTDHFIVTSGYAGRESSVLKLEAPSTGTDISGAGYLDLGENATEVAGDGDDYRLVRLDEDGKIPLNNTQISNNLIIVNILTGENFLNTGRNFDTWYQNTSDKPIVVSTSAYIQPDYAQGGASLSFQFALNTGSPISLASVSADDGDTHRHPFQYTAIIPAGYYYRLIRGGDYTYSELHNWTEYDLI